MREHELKTDPQVFDDVVEGRKPFEIRKDDRGYEVGDLLKLRKTKHIGAEMAEGAAGTAQGAGGGRGLRGAARATGPQSDAAGEREDAGLMNKGSNALGEGRERGILREASSREAATSTDDF